MDRNKGFMWLVAVLVAVTLSAGPTVAAEKKGEEKKAEAPAEKGVVYKFKSQDEMQEFANLYNAKMAIASRILVLQAYFGMEQQNMQQVDTQIKEKFGFQFDPNKQYELNTDNMEIREVEIPAAPAATSPAQK